MTTPTEICEQLRNPTMEERYDGMVLNSSVTVYTMKQAANLIAAQAAEIERLTKESDIAIGERIALSKLVRRLRDNFIDIRDELEDEGDRVYFGSTNDADEFREVVNELDSWGWHDLLRDEQQSAPFETSRKAIARALAAEAALEKMREAAAIGGSVPMLLWCPSCHERHIDEGEFATRPHHTHACQSCGMTWRPSVVPTCGVQFLPGLKSESSA